FADCVARALIERGAAAFLPNFLITALQRAVALAEMDGSAVAVAQHLDLDVARLREIFLEIKRLVSERGLRFGARGGKRRHELLRPVYGFHSPPAAPAAAWRRTGKPSARAADIAPSSEDRPPFDPGTTGMPSRSAVRLASILSPMRRICAGFGPMK